MDYKRINKINELISKGISDITFKQFRDIIEFNSYDLMKTVLNGKNYIAKGNYEGLTKSEATLIQLIEKTSQNVIRFKSKVERLIKSKLKEMQPEKAFAIEYANINWFNLDELFCLLNKEHLIK